MRNMKTKDPSYLLQSGGTGAVISLGDVSQVNLSDYLKAVLTCRPQHT